MPVLQMYRTSLNLKLNLTAIFVRSLQGSGHFLVGQLPSRDGRLGGAPARLQDAPAAGIQAGDET